jgi:5-methylcytosine-specific restriction endonuclease McrA
MALKPCIKCGRITTGSKCPACRRNSPYITPSWRQLSLLVIQRDGACVQCGSTHYLSAHHIRAREHGGADHPSNLVALCASCHGRETAAEQHR